MLFRLVPRLALLRRLSQSTSSGRGWGVPGSMLGRSPRTSATNYLDTTSALLTSLRRLAAALRPGADAAEAVFRVYAPLTISASSKQLTQADVALLARFLVECCSSCSPSFESDESPEASVFTRLLSDIIHSQPQTNTKLFNALAVLLPVSNKSIKSNNSNKYSLHRSIPHAPLPPIFDAFARLLLGDISRLKLDCPASTAIIPTLLSLRNLSSEIEASSILTHISSFQSTNSKDNSITNDQMYAAVIAAFHLSGRTDLSISFFDSLEKQNLGVLPYLSLIRVLTAAQDWDKALVKSLELVATVSDLQIRQSTINGILTTLLNSPTWDFSQKQTWIEKLEEAFWTRVSRLTRKQLSALEEGEGPYASFLSLIVKFYTTQQQQHQQAGFDAILTISRKLQSQNLNFSIYANNLILRFLLTSMKNRNLALLLFRDMSRSKRLNVYTMNIMLNGLFAIESKSPKDAGVAADTPLNLFATLQKIHPELKPDVITYTTLIDVCFKTGRIDQAKRFYETMRVVGVEPNLQTCTSLMDGLLRVGDLGTALRVFAGFREGRDVVMHTTVIHKMTTLQNDDAIKETYTTLKTQTNPPLSPDLVLFNILLKYLIQTRQPTYIAHILQELDTYNLTPDAYSSAAIIYGLVLSGEYKAVEPAALKLLHNGIPVTIHAVSGVINGLSHGKDVVAVVQWMEAFLQTRVVSKHPEALAELSTLAVSVNSAPPPRMRFLTIPEIEGVFREDGKGLSKLSLSSSSSVSSSSSSPAKSTPDFKFFTICVNALVRCKAVVCADLVVKYMVKEYAELVVGNESQVEVLMERCKSKSGGGVGGAGRKSE
ncbi:hypothetical protein BDR26DRAFT_1006207 [Obelidium mucronatum]|nr:hypothetical protein BDR26DRAFT_1006207 [Obelidium mucronatum]